MRPSLEELPAVPTGYEHFDLLWSQLIPHGASYVAVLPRGADPRWATAQGLRYVAISLLKQWEARAELQRTPNHSTLRRVRARHLQLQERQYHGQALTFVAALVDQAREAYPSASAAQLLTVARDGFKELLGPALQPESMGPSLGKEPK